VHSVANSAGVLFDVDGTLVDTTYLHTVCWAEALRGAGHELAMADIHFGVGMGSAELLDHLLGEERDTSEDEALIAAHLVLYRQYWGRLSPLPGARKLLRACADLGLRIVLASSASQEELQVLRSALDADELIAAATSSSDAESGKPRPDILQAALDESGMAADDAVFVGDSVWDGIAAARASVPFIAVTCGGTPATRLREAGAVEVWRDPANLAESLPQSILAGRSGGS
jgi:HAD superfamily hydrolase (TIGR01549 family)